jgi:EmrB/QacA subfamily drug resistance transporter
MKSGLRLSSSRQVLITVLLGTFAVSLNNTALNPAIPTFMTVFNIGAVTASWITTSFMLSMGLTMPVTGFLGQKLGKRRLYLFGLALFVIGSCIGSLATSMVGVLTARAIQGVASGFMIPLSLALIFSVYGKENRGKVTGLWGTLVMLAPALGPALGGFLVEFYRWQLLFAFNIPVGVAGWLIGFHALPEQAAQSADQQKFDWQGFVLISLGISLLLLSASRLTSEAALLNGWNIALLFMAVGCLVLFVRVELIKSDPLLNLRIFTVPSYTLSVVIVVVHAIGMFGCIFLLPLLMQQVLGYGPGWTGLAFLATALFSSLFSSVGGRVLDARGPRGVVVLGLLITALATLVLGLVGMTLFLTLSLTTSLWVVFGLMMVRGAGIGLSYMSVTTAGLNAIPEHWVTQGSAMNNILRRVSASVAMVLVSLYFQWRSTALQIGEPLHPHEVLSSQAASLTAINELFIAIAVLLMLTLPLALLLPRRELPKPELPKPKLPKPDQAIATEVAAENS